MFNGKIHYKWPFSRAMLNYQTVKRPRVGTVKLRMEGGFKALLQRLEAEKWLRENVAPWRYPPVAPTGGTGWGLGDTK